MLSIGWTEMMLVAAIALIVVGPRDLPGMLRHIGKAASSVRRMGNEFKSELNKITAVDEIRDLKRSITSPLTDTKAKIEKEFNSISSSGSVTPSGTLKPSDPNAESVVNEIHAAAGMETSTENNGAAAKASIAAAVTKAAKSQAEEKVAKATKPKTTRAKPKANKTKAKTAAKPKTRARKTAAKKPATSKSTATKSKAASTRKRSTAIPKKPDAKTSTGDTT